jgi:cytidylate kinase
MAGEGLAQLFERQRRRWEIDRRAGMPRPRGAVVSISQLPASGGEEIARRVAEWLDYGLFGLDAMREIAADPGLRGVLSHELEPSSLEAIEARVRQVFGAVSEHEASLHGVARVVATLGERGMAVVVGRGSSAILPSARTLRVLVVAPAEARAERLAAERKLAPAEAARVLAEEDVARLDFLRSRLGRTGDDPVHYDLVLNTERLPIDAAAALVVDAVRRLFPAGSGAP